ncbi:DUF3488 and DUF4129 domain-containing transglutaminase family protein [Lederbergia sp. NSJ-179]|uniref:transglutaminase TgpA family protein n=1 Tax=Lederbergia sp. NSJ-179 TaxID=2931402 RepID=UPI001FD5D490|nr:transglutaminaseTgpA domain-containing protein [Lederbergia sp. NSJ-179]MCJ7842643.1 DUF3488 and DUF4129 domain-containing transglutaminase family protein [Lederbergia sp. NSJ-179]
MKQKKMIYLSLTYCLGFFLLWEWLRPLGQITNTGSIHYFVYFLLLSLFLYFIRIRYWVGFLLKILFIYLFLFLIFGKESSGLFGGSYLVLQDCLDNIKLLRTGQFDALSDLFRTALFFIFIWIVIYLFQYWLEVKRRMFVFLITTIFYIGVLDTFTKYDAKWAIIRIISIGFVLLGLLFFQRLIEKENIVTHSYAKLKWAVPLVAMIGVSVCIGYITPKAGPIWPDPVPFIQSQADNVLPRNNDLSRIGYGEDDSNLGGPFLSDDRVVFEAETRTRQYWRVETKDMYTGKGWTTANDPDPQGHIETGDLLTVDPFIHTGGDTYKANISMKIVYPHILIPYGFNSVHGNQDGFFRYDPVLNKLTSYKSRNSPVELDQYTVEYKKTAFSMKEMRETDQLPNDSQFEGIMDQYTQLPTSLPERVRDLAHEIMGEHDNWFDKAKAVEQYFRNGEFTYNQQDVAVPEKDQDYVDQFLFETKQGYCDNFSTSMVTLLRAEGIPARWAKGYAPGRYIGVVEGDPENRRYEVTNNDAHSWVEVFFPTQGWVPFEPTIGFDHTTAYSYDEESNESTSAVSQNNPTQPKPQEEADPKEEKKNEPKTEVKDKADTTKKKASHLKDDQMYFLSIGIGLVCIGVFIFWTRNRWIPYFLLWKYRRKPNQDVLVEAYGKLLKQLERFGLKRKNGQTLRDFAAYIDDHFETKDMGILTEYYEREIYRDRSIKQNNWEATRELWENLIKKTTS